MIIIKHSITAIRRRNKLGLKAKYIISLSNVQTRRLTGNENKNCADNERKKKDKTSECCRTIDIRNCMSNFHTSNTKTKKNEYYSEYNYPKTRPSKMQSMFIY